MASRDSTVGAVCYLGFQSMVEIHHKYTWHTVRFVFPSHCKHLNRVNNFGLSLEKKHRDLQVQFFSKYALRHAHGRPVPEHLPQVALRPWRWMQMSVSYGGRSVWPFRWIRITPLTRKQSEMVQNMQSKKKAHKLEEQIWFACNFMSINISSVDYIV